MNKYKVVSKKGEEILNVKQIAEKTGYSVMWTRKKIWNGEKFDGFDIFQAKITFFLQRMSKYTYYDWKTMVKAHSYAELCDLSGRSDKWFKDHYEKLTSSEGYGNKQRETAWRLVEKIEWEKI